MDPDRFCERLAQGSPTQPSASLPALTDALEGNTVSLVPVEGMRPPHVYTTGGPRHSDQAALDPLRSNFYYPLALDASSRVVNEPSGRRQSGSSAASMTLSDFSSQATGTSRSTSYGYSTPPQSPIDLNPGYVFPMGGAPLYRAMDFGIASGTTVSALTPAAPPSTFASHQQHTQQLPSSPQSFPPSLPTRVGVTSFISRLFSALEHEAHFGDYMRWCPGGETFMIDLGNSRLADEVLPYLYSHKSQAAFTRQLNIYSFKKPKDVERLHLIQQLPPDLRGPDWRAYRHPLFTQDEPGELYKVRPRQSPARKLKKAANLAQSEEGLQDDD